MVFLECRSAISDLSKIACTCIIYYQEGKAWSFGWGECSSNCLCSDEPYQRSCSEVASSREVSFFRLGERPSSPFDVWTILSMFLWGHKQDLQAWAWPFLENWAFLLVPCLERGLPKTIDSLHTDTSTLSLPFHSMEDPGGRPCLWVLICWKWIWRASSTPPRWRSRWSWTLWERRGWCWLPRWQAF